MTTITKQEVRALANVHESPCLSLFLPTHSAGQEVLNEEDALALKIQTKEVKLKLQHLRYDEADIKTFIKPLEHLMEDSTFWKHQSEGLAIFLSHSTFKYYTLPINFKPFNYVAHDFYLQPLMPMFAGDRRFFILTLEKQEVKFYERTGYGITEVFIDELTPARLEEVVGYDYKQKNLQYKSNAPGLTTYHGQGEGKDDEKKEVTRYLRAINKGLMKMLHDESSPLIIACLDDMFPLYQSVNEYPYLYDEFINCHPSSLDLRDLHEKAWQIMEPYFNRTRDSKLALFNQFDGTSRATTYIEDIIPAALSGKVDTLFLTNDLNIWGTYDPDKSKVKIDERSEVYNTSLTNLAAVQTFLQGGHVYNMSEESLPSAVCALFRY